MTLLVETIKIFNGRRYNLDGHESRVRRSRKRLFGVNSKIGLKKKIIVPDKFKSGLVKCRVIYGKEIENIEFSPYSIRNISSSKIVISDYIEYPDKLINRSELTKLYHLKQECDEIIIVKNGFVTDSFYYNLVFEKEGRYYTPKHPLLLGTQRQYLLSKNAVIPINIGVEDILYYKKIHFINALTQIGQCTMNTSNIVF